MLKRFKVSNFKSLVNVEFSPVGLNLLVGANNAGKTNFCHALRFLGLTSRMGLDDAARECTAEPWNLLNVYTSDDTMEMEVSASLPSGKETGEERLEFTYNLKLWGRRNGKLGSPARPFAIEHECLKVSGGRFNQTPLLENEKGTVRLLHEGRFGHGLASEFLETTAPTDTTMLYRLYDLQTNQRANLFKRYLSSWAYYNLYPGEMRSNLASPMDRTLNAAGSNLCSVLFTLHNERPRDERKLVETLKLVEPRLDVFSYQAPDPDHVYLFLEDKQGHRFGVHNISDGTLRYLAISLLIIGNRADSEHSEFSPLILIEEPENGIYVGHLKPLFEKLDPSGAQGQFLFTSHNPYFIDLFDGALEGVHLVKNLGNYTAVTRPDIDRLKAQLGKFSLGEMHFRGLLE
jgi:predicted ATPase